MKHGDDRSEMHPQDGGHGEYVAADDAIIGKAFKWSVIVMLMIAIAGGAGYWLTRPVENKEAPTEVVLAAPQKASTTVEPPSVTFTDITSSSGIDFTHENGATGDKLLPETMGSGVAFIDYDNDGDQDLFFANGTGWQWDDDRRVGRMRLYRNDGKGNFEDVTAEAGITQEIYGMGVAIGDLDGDRWNEIFVAGIGRDLLLKNNQGTFEDITERAGVGGEAMDWSTCPAMFDYDNDGDLDIYVGNYVRWSREIDFEVDYRLVGGERSYGPPMNFQGTFPYLYRNDGDVFTDVTADAGLQVTNPATGDPMGKALAVMPVDIDEDGFMDMLIANDTVQNFFFHNKGDGSFEEVGMIYGLAFDRNGAATGAMGVDAGYYRNDESIGFFIGNFANEMTSLYVSQGVSDLFADEAIGEGIGAPTRLQLSFGVHLFDYDLDGRLDLLQTNGHLEEEINLVQPSQHYEQPSQLFWNCGLTSRGCFVPVQGESSGDLAKPIVGRGSAFGDLDGDGDLDVVLTQAGRRAIVLRNDQQLGNNWLRIKVDSNGANTHAIGATITAEVDGQTLRRRVMPTRSYLCQSEQPVVLGLGKASSVDKITVRFPNGKSVDVTNLSANRSVTINTDGMLR